MPHPITQTAPAVASRGWGQEWGDLPWGGEPGSLGTDTGQVVIRHDRSTTKKKRLRQRQRMN